MDVRDEAPVEALDADPPHDADDDEHDVDDDVVVLSWWQHPVNVVALIVAVALMAGMVGWLVADVGAERDAGDVDVGFLQDMRVHHEQAVQMGFMFLALPDTDPGLRTVARSIVTGQNLEVGRMIQLLRDLDAPEGNETGEAMAWMGMATPEAEMPGMATEAELDAFGATSGAAADEAFVDLMVAHHAGGLHMAEFAAAEAQDEAVRSMARSIAASQTHEIAELEGLVDR